MGGVIVRVLASSAGSRG